MIIPIELRFKADKDSKSAFRTDKTIKSHDVNSVEFHISIDGLELTDNHTAKILSVFHSSKSQANVECEIVEGKIIYKPDTNLISRHEHVTNYVYVYHNNQSLDLCEFLYTVSLSKIDETSLEVKEVYDQSYADLLADFEQALSDYKDSLPQADSVRAEIDVILDKFSVDSQTKLSQLDADAQQVIVDNQTAFWLAESNRQSTYEQAEDSRNQASNQAVADWKQGADALIEIVEVNESARVDAESSRKTAETDRASSETTRKSNEASRQVNELVREEAEGVRQSTFETNESARQANELTRVTAESDRVANEAERISKDSERDSKIDEVTAQLTQTVGVNVTNIVKNGSFESGVTNWRTYGSDGISERSVSTNQKYIGNNSLFISRGVGGRYGFGYQQKITQIVGNKYYLSVSSFFPLSSLSTANSILTTDDQSIEIVLERNLKNVWTQESRIYTGKKVDVNLIVSSIATSDYESEVYIDGILLVDLTTTFGAGNEPTAEQMDRLIEIIGYIDGEYALNNKEMLIWTLALIRRNKNAIVALGGA